MRLNDQISEAEYIAKKHDLVNQKAELKATADDFERNRSNRFEPAIAFIKEAKNAGFVTTPENFEEKRDFLKKIGSNFQVAEKTLSLDFKNPWKIVVEFNSTFTASTAAGGQNHETSNWRREGDSNPRYGF